MATTKGIGVVYGTGVTAASFSAAAEITSTSESFEKNYEKEELPDRFGSIGTILIKKLHHTLKLKCYPSGATATAGGLPSIFEEVTVVSTDADINGLWLAEKISSERKIDGITEFDLGLIRYLNDDGIQNHTIMTATWNVQT